MFTFHFMTHILNLVLDFDYINNLLQIGSRKSDILIKNITITIYFRHTFKKNYDVILTMKNIV